MLAGERMAPGEGSRTNTSRLSLPPRYDLMKAPQFLVCTLPTLIPAARTLQESPLRHRREPAPLVSALTSSQKSSRGARCVLGTHGLSPAAVPWRPPEACSPSPTSLLPPLPTCHLHPQFQPLLSSLPFLPAAPFSRGPGQETPLPPPHFLPGTSRAESRAHNPTSESLTPSQNLKPVSSPLAERRDTQLYPSLETSAAEGEEQRWWVGLVRPLPTGQAGGVRDVGGESFETVPYWGW